MKDLRRAEIGARAICETRHYTQLSPMRTSWDKLAQELVGWNVRFGATRPFRVGSSHFGRGAAAGGGAHAPHDGECSKMLHMPAHEVCPALAEFRQLAILSHRRQQDNGAHAATLTTCSPHTAASLRARSRRDGFRLA